MSAFMIDRKDYLNFSVQLHRFCNAPMPPHYTLELLRSLWRFPPADVTSTWAWRVDRLVRLMMLANRRAVWLRIPVKLNSDSGICEHHFRKVCGQGFFEQKLSFEGRHLFDSLNKPAAKRSAAVVDPRRWNRTVHLTSEYVH
ncbi:hypothetical protein ACQZQZ_06205 [Aeromonas salmonicida subsp. pectinolytica]